MRLARRPLCALTLVVLGWVPLGAQTPVGTAFTYQGRLTDGGSPANGTYDLQFTLYDAADGGNPVGSPVPHPNVPVAGGVFTVLLDFGASAFTGSARWLEVGVRPGGTGGGFVIVSPRHPLTPLPYALDSQRLGGLPPASYQARVTGACGSPNFMRAVGADGSVTCVQVDFADISGSLPEYVTQSELGVLATELDALDSELAALGTDAARLSADNTFSGSNTFDSGSNSFSGQVRVVPSASAACDAGRQGALRYDSASQNLEFCDGSAWRAPGPQRASVTLSGTSTQVICGAAPSTFVPVSSVTFTSNGRPIFGSFFYSTMSAAGGGGFTKLRVIHTQTGNVVATHSVTDQATGLLMTFGGSGFSSGADVTLQLSCSGLATTIGVGPYQIVIAEQ
jgi:hypothetical protein